MSNNDFNKKLAQRKTVSRLLAVQALYSADMTGEEGEGGWSIETLDQDLLQCIEEYADGGQMPKIEKSFLKKAVAHVLTHKEELDDKIRHFLTEGWSIDKLGPLLSAILRMAAYEILKDNKVSKSVIVSEYVYVAGEFFEADEIKFVNAVVDNMAVILRENPDNIEHAVIAKKAALAEKPKVLTEVRNAKARMAEIMANASDGTPKFTEDGKRILTLRVKKEESELVAENVTVGSVEVDSGAVVVESVVEGEPEKVDTVVVEKLEANNEKKSTSSD